MSCNKNSAPGWNDDADLDEGIDISLLLPSWPQPQPLVDSLSMPALAQDYLSRDGHTLVLPAAYAISVSRQGELSAPQDAAHSKLISRDPAVQLPECSTWALDGAASQLGVFADRSSDDEVRLRSWPV